MVLLLLMFAAGGGVFSLHSNWLLSGGLLLVPLLLAIGGSIFLFKGRQQRFLGGFVLVLIAWAAYLTSNSIVSSRVLERARASVRNGGSEGFSVLFYDFKPFERDQQDASGGRQRTYIFTSPAAWYFVRVVQEGDDVRAQLRD